MYTIQKEFSFSASHQLEHLPSNHQCARLHGHNYRVDVLLESDQTDERGFVVDYGDLDIFKQFLDDHFDHRHLNEVMGCSQLTTAEHLANYFFMWLRNRFPQVGEVKVSETPKTWATYMNNHHIKYEYYPNREVLRPPWNQINEHIYRQLFPDLNKSDNLSFLTGHEEKQIKTLQNMIERRGDKFHIATIMDNKGTLRYALVQTDTLQIYFGGQPVGLYKDMIERVTPWLPTDRVNSWKHAFSQDPFTLVPMPQFDLKENVATIIVAARNLINNIGDKPGNDHA